VLQLLGVKVRLDELTVPSELLLLLTLTVTLLEGVLFRATLNVEVVPSSEVLPERLVIVKKVLLSAEALSGVADNNSDGHQDYQISLSATVGVYENDITDNLNSSAYSFSSGSSPSHGNQDPEMAFDGTTNTKHFNSSGAGTGVIINTGTNKTVTTLGLTTANDRENRDPTSFSLYGSNNGSSWTSIVGNASLSPPASRYTNYSNVSISNSTAYQYFKLIWETTRQTTGPAISGATSDNGVQVSEIRLGGTLNAVQSVIVEMHNLDDEINVKVDVASSNTSEGTVSPATLTFTPNNWSTRIKMLSVGSPIKCHFRVLVSM